MKHRQIEAFRQVMLTGTTIEAANALSVTQPAISRLISDLESELSFSLFERKGGRLHATPEAHRLMSSVERVFIGLDELDLAAEQIRTSQPADLIICATHSISTFVLPRAIASFRKQQPRTGLLIENLPSTEIASSLQRHRANLGISHAFPETHGVKQEDLIEAAHVCALPAGHRLAKKKVIRPADLEGENVIRILPVGSVNWEQTKHILDSANVQYESNLGIQSSFTGYSLIAAGLAIALIEPFAAPTWQANGVVVRPFEPQILYRYVIAYGVNQQESDALRQFVAHVHEIFDQGKVLI